MGTGAVLGKMQWLQRHLVGAHAAAQASAMLVDVGGQSAASELGYKWQYVLLSRTLQGFQFSIMLLAPGFT